MAAIEAEKLNFTYPDADRAALSDVTFSIPSGGFLFADGAIRQRQEHFTAAAARGDRASRCFARAAPL